MRRATELALTSMLVCGLAAVALAQEATPRDPTRPGPPRPDAAEAARSPEERARRARVIARIGEVTIRVGDVEDAINEQSPYVRVRYRDREELRAFVRGMIRFELLARAAERAGLGEDDEVARAAKQNAVQQLIRRDFDERITVESVPQADVQAYYDAHPAEFSSPELRRAAHIRVATREEAERLLGQARDADTRAFRELAREHSTDPETRLRGGDLRYFDDDGRPRNPRDPRVDEGLARAAFGLENLGDVTAEPVPLGEEWSIVKLTGRRPAEHRSVEQAGPTIRLRLWRQSRQSSIEDFVSGLRRRAGIDEIDYGLLRRIRLDEPEREDAEDSVPPQPETPPENEATPTDEGAGSGGQ